MKIFDPVPWIKDKVICLSQTFQIFLAVTETEENL
jgi:hypothetical protein